MFSQNRIPLWPLNKYHRVAWGYYFNFCGWWQWNGQQKILFLQCLLPLLGWGLSGNNQEWGNLPQYKASRLPWPEKSHWLSLLKDNLAWLALTVSSLQFIYMPHWIGNTSPQRASLDTGAGGSGDSRVRRGLVAWEDKAGDKMWLGYGVLSGSLVSRQLIFFLIICLINIHKSQQKREEEPQEEIDLLTETYSFEILTAKSFPLPTYICILTPAEYLLYMYLQLPSLVCMCLNCCHVASSWQHQDKEKSEKLSALFLLWQSTNCLAIIKIVSMVLTAHWCFTRVMVALTWHYCW